jgi:ParB family chromosome partitioning protein
MADNKKNILEAAPPAEAPAPTAENAAVPEQPAPEPVLTDAEAVMLEHEGQAALFEMGEAVPDPADAVTHAEVEEPTAPEVPKAEKEQAQPPDPGRDDPAPAHSGKVVDFAAARDEAAKEEKKAIKQKPPKEKGKPAKPGKGRPPKTEKTAPEQTKPPKAGKTHAAPEEKAAPPAPEVPPTPRDATRTEKEEIVYLDLSDLHPFKDHPFGVRDDAEMKSLVESVRNSGVNQPALVRPREGGGYEIIAGHRRQMASQLAGYRNMPCIVRNMTDDEAILAMTDDNLRQRETILPSEKAMSLKMQYEAIKHQGARGDSAEAGKLSLESVGQRNGMSVKTVQRYIWLNDLVPELKQTMDDGKLSFTPAVEISRVRPKHQKYIAVSIEGQQASPSKGQAKRLRELDKENKLSPDVIDGILCEEKKKEDRDVIITGAELEKFFGKEATPRQMKDQIMTLLEDWKERQPPELAKPDKKMDMEK